MYYCSVFPKTMVGQEADIMIVILGWLALGVCITMAVLEEVGG